VTAVALLFLFLDRPHKGWLIASGLMLGLSFTVKALNPFVAAPIGLLLLLYHSRPGPPDAGPRLIGRLMSPDKQWGRLGLDLLAWGGGVCLPLVVVLLLYEPAAVYDQLIIFRSDLRAAIPGAWLETWQQFWLFAAGHWGFWLLAIGGIISTGWRAFSQKPVEADVLSHSAGSTQVSQTVTQASFFVLYNLVWSVWLLAGIAMLAWHTPLFPHHFIVLLPPLILLGGGLVVNLVVLWANRRKYGPAARSILLVLCSLLLGAAFNVPAMVRANQSDVTIVTGGREQEAIQLLRVVSNPTDFLMGDSQLLIFLAGRRTPPPLGDVALVAIKANRQTTARMITLTETYQAPAVVQWSLRLPWLPEYLEWVQAHYLTRRVWDDDHIIYFGRRLPPGQPIPNEQLVRLHNGLALRGYQLDPASPRAGQDLNLKVYWQTEVPLREDYTIFTQLLDEQGRLVVSQDSQPLAGYLPTGAWPVGEIVTDVVHVPLPASLPPGDYTLVTGVYLLETLERLPLLDSAGDYIALTTITIGL
jgi:hypothetical protein